MIQPLDRWQLAVLGAAALAVDPAGLHGMTIRDRAGPVRDTLLDLVTKSLDRPVHRLPADASPAALGGGIDLGATLREGRQVTSQGLLDRATGALLIVPMAERLDSNIAAFIAGAYDWPDPPVLVLLDEGAEADEVPPRVLTERLSISVSLEGLSHRDAPMPDWGTTDIEAARRHLMTGIADGEAPETLARLAAAMGITSVRAPLLALRLTRVIAALEEADEIGESHIAAATALCLAPRAVMMPSIEDNTEDAPPPPPPDEDQDAEKAPDQQTQDGPMDDRVLEAVAAVLPDLHLAASRRGGSGGGGGAGQRKRSVTHGRPLVSRPGNPADRRLDVYASLVAAAPWQPVRRRTAPDREGLIVRPDDLRVLEFERPAESVLIFLVDASGSQAAARMAEAKGAVELMLSEAYRRREKVALIAFRGTSADLVLPPTRSLLQAKRRLAVLPGGGPTPLAAALVAGRALASQIRRGGATPYLIVLTDGRGNIALSGEPGRAEAADDQLRTARAIAAEGITAVLIDTANRPQADAKTLAAAMGAEYLPLPRADAHQINKLVRSSVAA
ncbi:MAG: magnesium chelatase subunit D [Pseudomonadota bacterium]